MVYLLAGDELAVVEAVTLFQELFDVGNNKFAGMLVDGSVQFLLYHGEYTPKYFHFLGGEMQSLGTGITEELVTIDLPA